MPGWFSMLRSKGLAVQLAFLSLVELVALAVVSPVAWRYFGSNGLVSAAVAAGMCWTGAAVALTISRAFSGPEGVLLAVLLGMAARMGIPLGLGVLIYLQGGPLANSGLFYYLLAFYPITLGTETALSLPETKTGERESGASR